MSNSNDYTNRIIIDWIAFTTTDDFELNNLIDFEFEYQDMERGMLGYKSMAIEQTTKIKNLRDGNVGMGQHFIISGQSCRILEHFKINLLDFIIELIADSTISVTRLDIAMDIFKDKKLLELIIDSYNLNNYSSKAKSSNILISKSENGRTGTTINFGSRQSAVLIRIYDKGAEQDLEVDWIRFEIECKDKKYNRKIINNIRDDGIAETFKGLMNNYIRFLEYRDTNISRSPSATWWSKIINSINKIKLYESPSARSISEVKEWLLSQVSANFATVLQAEQSRQFIDEMISTGTEKMKNKHWNMVY